MNLQDKKKSPIEINEGSPLSANASGDALVIFVPACDEEGDSNIKIQTEEHVENIVKKALELDEFSGKKGDEIIFYDYPKFSVKRLILLGIGEKKDLDYEAFRSAAGKAVKLAIKKGFKEISIAVPSGETTEAIKLDNEKLIKAIGEGAYLGNFRSDLYKTESELKSLEKIKLLVSLSLAEPDKLLSEIDILCQGTIAARTWVLIPSIDKTPDIFAKMITDEAKDIKTENLSISLFEKNELKKMGMGGILAVGAGSDVSPKFLVLDYNPKSSKQKYVFVGKGVTFDSGGLNLKPGTAMDGMKGDMSGAAAVAASVLTIARLNLKKRVIGIIPIVENMPSGKALRPGDVIKIYNGKTVEIGNTDAEGRLILADAIAYGEKEFSPEIIIDVATLTGACVVALGEKIAGVFSDNDELAEKIVSSGKNVNEICWRMPLFGDYKKLLKSELADTNNISSSRWGGAITAALFLSEFVKDTNWAHIDIAGPAFSKQESDYCAPGGTGFGVRLLTDFVLSDSR